MSVHHTRLNKIYEHMKDRCYNPNFHCYNRYGGRGITICKEWLEDYQAFKAWALSHGYSDNLTLDRIDNNKGYYPENCRWISAKEQANNKRNNHLITYKGETKTLVQWAESLGIDRSVLSARINKLGWSISKSFETKTRKYKRVCDTRTE